MEQRLSDWDTKQLKAIEFFQKIDFVMSNSFIAVISVTDATSTDEQKIFNLINSNGTPLTAAEVLSAKPAWNKKINGTLSNEIKSNIKKLYLEKLEIHDIDLDECVKWDLPAVLPSLLKNLIPLNSTGL